MNIGELAQEKTRLKRDIFRYEKQRQQKRVVLGEDIEGYKKYSSKISMRIYNSKKKIKRLEEKINKIVQLEDAIVQFLGFSPKESPYSKNGKIARRFFYRWGMENGVNGAYLRKYIGQKGKHAPSIYRMALIRLSSPEEKDTWNRFKNFMKNRDYEAPVGVSKRAEEVWKIALEFVDPKRVTDKKLALYLFYRWARGEGMDGTAIQKITGQYRKTIEEAEENYHSYFNKSYNTIKFDRRKKWEEFNKLVKESSNQFG